MRGTGYAVGIIVRWFAATLCFGAAAIVVWAEPVSQEEAALVANGWYTLRFQEAQDLGMGEAKQPQVFAAKDARRIEVGGTLIGYAFDTFAGGCIVVTAEDQLSPIVYYSPKGSLGVPAVPPAQAILEDLAAQIARLQQGEPGSRDPSWDILSTSVSGQVKDAALRSFGLGPVGPLLTSTWDQLEPYNDQCPAYFGERCVVGCVATAMAQTMRYWRHPERGTGSHCYLWPLGNETLCAEFSSAVYDWASMPDRATVSSSQQVKDAVSTLCFHCGVSIETGYAPVSYGGSSAYFEDVGPALTSHFGYGYPRYILKEDYPLSDWYNLMCAQIDARQPVLYGSKEHAIVLDGYDRPNLVHLNMGWGGVNDGWYLIYEYAGGQTFTDAVVDIHPNAPTVALSPMSLFNACDYGKDAPSQTFEVWNSGIGTLTYSISDDAAWLVCNPTTGTSTGEHDTIQVVYKTSGLASGLYSGTIKVTAPGAMGSPGAIAVSLSVRYTTPAIGFSPTALSSVCELGQDASPRTFEIWNAGVGSLGYSVTDDVQWLSCSPNSGDSAGERDVIEVVYTTSGLPAGKYTGTITIKAPGAVGTPAAIPVQLTVERPYTVWYVDGAVSSSGDGTSWETAFKKVQEALDASARSDRIIVAQGTYRENIRFNGKSVQLMSVDPLNPSTVANTIIDGNKTGSVVSFDGTEVEACVLSGFTIQNGSAQEGGGIYGGPAERHTHATILDNIFLGNSAQWGGGICRCDGNIENNIISGNSSAWYGGGLLDCDGTIRSNLIMRNSAKKSGGGASNCDGPISSNTIIGNAAAEQWGGGLYFCKGTITNCIFWGNTAQGGPQLHGCSAPTYSCIQGWTAGGEGNLPEDPGFVNLAGEDYRLSQDSPCIDVGRNEIWMTGAADLDGNPRIWPGKLSATVDIGAYEFGSTSFGMLGIGASASGNASLRWRSRSGARYTIWSRLDLVSGMWGEEATVDSQGSETSWADTSPPQRKKFYRIELKNPR